MVHPAYSDPNIGGLLYQIVFPVFVATAAIWALLKQRASASIKRLLRRPDEKKSLPE
jgi:GTP cyclohydrolase FolE2